MAAKSIPLWGTCMALMNVMRSSWHLILIFTPMHFSFSNKSIHYLNQDKHIYQDAHREKCIGVSAEHASAGTRVLSASTRVPEHLRYICIHIFYLYIYIYTYILYISLHFTWPRWVQDFPPLGTSGAPAAQLVPADALENSPDAQEIVEAMVGDKSSYMYIL